MKGRFVAQKKQEKKKSTLVLNDSGSHTPHTQTQKRPEKKYK